MSEDEPPGMEMGPPSKPPEITDKDTAVEQMTEWFFANFEDPAESTPYESAEGGYQYIWGGPYDAREVLEDAFYDQMVKALGESEAEVLIDFVTKRVEENGWEWVGSESRMREEKP